jgi:hypothetical protein
VREIIAKVLLPAIGRRLDPDDRETFVDVFSGGGSSKEADTEKWARIVKLVFLPIVRQWLSDLTNNSFGNPEENGHPWQPGDIMGPDGPLIDKAAANDFNAFLSEKGLGEEVFKLNAPLEYVRETLKACVNETFGDGLRPLAKYVTAFGVDLVSLSGKPSELPQVKELLDDLLPLLPERIIRIKDYEAGPWYPMGMAGKISDAKTVTAVGAALYRAISKGHIEAWSIAEEEDRTAQQKFNSNAWGKCRTKGNGFGDKKGAFLERESEPGASSEPVKMMLKDCIGRMKFTSRQTRAEQQYQLVWREPEEYEKEYPGRHMVEVAFERCELGDDGNDMGIKLVDGTVTINGKEMSTDVLELKLCTLEGGSFWMETAEFDVEFDD